MGCQSTRGAGVTKRVLTFHSFAHAHSPTMVFSSSFGASGSQNQNQNFNNDNNNNNNLGPPPGSLDSLTLGQLKQMVTSAPKPKACPPPLFYLKS